MARGTVMDKLKWIYALYDVNRDGDVTKDELKSVIASVYDMTGKTSNDDVIEYHTNAVIKVVAFGMISRITGRLKNICTQHVLPIVQYSTPLQIKI